MILPHTNITPIPTIPKPAATPSLWNTRQAEIDENFAAVKAAVEAGDTGLTNHLADTVDAHDASAISNVPSGNLAATTVQDALNELQADIDKKDASGGYAGLTLFKINFKNALNTFTSFFTNANTAARTYTFQDRDGTIADNTDLALKAPLASPALTGNPTAPTQVPGTNNTTLANTAFVQALFATMTAIADATTLVKGILKTATDALTQAGIDATTAVTPASLSSRTATEARTGLVELATDAETQTGTDSVRAITPSNLSSRTATETRTGVVELATDAEAQAFTADKFIDGAKLNTAFKGSNQSLATSGYQKLSGGLIIQWGTSGSVASAASVDVTLPIAFPNANVNVQTTNARTSLLSGVNDITGYALSLTQVRLFNNQGSGSTTIEWLAIGY